MGSLKGFTIGLVASASFTVIVSWLNYPFLRHSLILPYIIGSSLFLAVIGLLFPTTMMSRRKKSKATNI